MDHVLLQQAMKLNKERKRKQRWQKAVRVMAAVVVFCTTYALILPAITMERQTVCGMEAHEHDESCYTQQAMLTLQCPVEGNVIHTHGDRCYDDQGELVCTLPQVEEHIHTADCYTQNSEFVCQITESDPHTHGEDCYETTQTSVCSHQHDDACYTEESVLSCTLAESEGHTHTDACMAVTEILVCEKPVMAAHSHTQECFNENGEPVCTLPEGEGHMHTADCYTQNSELVCQIPESDPHTHGEDCYEMAQTCVCGHQHDDTCYTEESVLCCTPEESEGHIHTDDCKSVTEILVCEKPVVVAHSHTQECFDENDELVCELEEYQIHNHDDQCMADSGQTELVLTCQIPVHVHEDACYPAEEATAGQEGCYCGYGEHTHTDDCYDAEGALSCSVPEHTHTALCQVENYDATADVESQTDWEATLAGVTLTNQWPEDLVNIAKTQVGYSESTRNVVLNASGTLAGYSRYGTWYGSDYAEWNSLFVMFCMDYAGISHVPTDTDCAQWARELTEKGIFRSAGNYEANPGDLMFLDTDADGSADRVGIVSQVTVEPAQLTAIEGNVHGSVQNVTYDPADTQICGYGLMPPAAESTLAAEGADYTVTVRFGVDAWIPADAVLTVREIEAGTEEYETYYRQSAEALGTEIISFARFFDISFLVEDQIIEPSAPVEVRVRYAEAVAIAPEESGMAVHFANDGVEVLDAATGDAEETDTFVFTQDSFSVSGTVVTSESSDGSFTATGDFGTATLTLTNGEYSPDDYDLVIQAVDVSGYMDSINTYLSSNSSLYPRREVEKALVYEISLVSKTDSSQTVSLPSAYTLVMELTDSGLNVSSIGAAAVLDLTWDNVGSPNSHSVACTDGVVTGLTVTQQWSSMSRFAVVTLGGITEGTTNSGYSLTYNEQTDAFIKDSAYADCYNEDSPIGTAGSFHIVAFDTATLSTHTNGNILAKNLVADSNFGTNNYAMELTYIQNYLKVNANSASSENHILVVGSSNEITLYDNNNKYQINGQGIDRPKNLVQDKDTDTAPFINLGRVETEIRQIAADLAGYGDANLKITIESQKNIIALTNPDAVGILNVTPADTTVFGKDYIQLAGFESGYNGTIVINVDCAGYTEINMPKALVVLDGKEQSTNEVVEFSNGKVLWNFINAEGVTINTHLMTGMLIAPGATVNIMQNLNGTVVAENVNVKAESHRTDFTGRIVPQSETESTSVTIKKIRSGYVGTTLSGAHFDLYIWNGADWKKVNTESIITDSNGLFLLESLETNTAYKLVETQAPVGYVLMDEPFNFWVRATSSDTAPTLAPEDYSGKAVDSGAILNISNEPDTEVETTSITVEKVWNTENTVDVTRIEVSVYQIAWRDGYEIERKLYKTAALSAALGWKYTVTDLPLTGTDDAGNPLTYTYAVEETAISGYTASYSENNQNGVTEGTLTITNTPSSGGYRLPETGGMGTHYHTFGGLLILAGAMMYLITHSIRRRREDEGA